MSDLEHWKHRFPAGDPHASSNLEEQTCTMSASQPSLPVRNQLAMALPDTTRIGSALAWPSDRAEVWGSAQHAVIRETETGEVQSDSVPQTC